MLRKSASRLLGAVALLLATSSLAQAQILIGATDYNTDLNAAVDAAVTGDTIYVPDGTYLVSSTLNIDQDITLQGQSEALTVVQINTGSSWGVKLAADGIVIQDISFESISPGAEQGYVIHGQGTADPGGDGYDDLELRRVTVFGDQTTTPKRRAGVDIHGFNNVVLDDVESRDASWGNGVQVTGCVGVTMTNVSTSNNAWGSVAVYVSGPTLMNRASSNVVIDGPSLSAGENVVFMESAGGVDNTNVSVTGWDYQVRNSTFRAGATNFTYFVDTQSNAVLFGLAFAGFEDASTVQRISDGNFVVAPGLSIQAAVDEATSSDTVEVLAGSYEEQVEIAKDLVLQGAGAASTTIVSPDNLVDFFTTSADNYPVVYVHDADGVEIRDLTVDGADKGAANARFYGVAYRNAGGGVYDCVVTGTRVAPAGSINGSQHGNAIYLYNNDTTTRSFDVHGNVVGDFQKNGITVNSLDATATVVDIRDNAVTGSGVLTFDLGEPAQNGLQLYGALISGLVENNTVSGIAYDNTNNPTKYVATTMLDYYSSADFVGNIVPDSQVGLYKYSASGQVSGNDITVNKVGVSAWGIIATDPPNAIPQPFGESGSGSGAMLARKAVLNVIVSGNTVIFSGVDNTSTFGIEADSGYTAEDLAITITDNVVQGFEAGVDVYECQSGCDTGVFTSVAINDNDLSNNTYGVRSNASITVDASCNWFGDVSGPLETVLNPAATGSAVEGDVIFEPWLDAPQGNCNLSTNSASVGPAPGELSACDDCLDIAVVIDRLDTSTARGVSVTFTLSPELELCGTPALSVGASTFYDGFSGDVQTFFLENLDGSYTFDAAILGVTCGPTGGGELFTIPVTYAGSVVADTQGSIDVTSVTFRACDNTPLPLLPGPGTMIDIDVTAPGAITGLNATQQLTGNDSNGTTKINLGWTLPADLDVTGIDLYRKGFGSYPEYDDAGGSVPSTPADPATALSNGWTLVNASPIAPTATSYVDEPSVRDFWYYVAFAADECYTSAVSNQTSGALNYHLGDVAPAPNGNNLVFTGDISALGAAYGTTSGDLDYEAVADVGPTTDFSVSARPTTDNRVQFEDLIVFAINYNAVSRAPAVQPAALNAVTLVQPAALPVGEEITVAVRMQGQADLRGVSVSLAWSEDVLEYVGYAAGDLLAAQGGQAPLFSPRPGVLDAAVLGDKAPGIAGDGVLAQLRFRVRKSGDPQLRFDGIDARNAANEKVQLDGTVISGTPGNTSVVKRSALRANVPNPFNPSTKVRYAVSTRGDVSVKVYDVSGRLVRTLVSGVIEAGEHEIVWDGRDDGGRSVASGAYLMRLSAPDATDARRLTLVK